MSEKKSTKFKTHSRSFMTLIYFSYTRIKRILVDKLNKIDIIIINYIPNSVSNLSLLCISSYGFSNPSFLILKAYNLSARFLLHFADSLCFNQSSLVILGRITCLSHSISSQFSLFIDINQFFALGTGF